MNVYAVDSNFTGKLRGTKSPKDTNKLTKNTSLCVYVCQVKREHLIFSLVVLNVVVDNNASFDIVFEANFDGLIGMTHKTLSSIVDSWTILRIINLSSIIVYIL